MCLSIRLSVFIILQKYKSKLYQPNFFGKRCVFWEETCFRDVVLLYDFANELDAAYQPLAFLVAVADVEKTIEGGLVQLGEGGVVLIDALGQIVV